MSKGDFLAGAELHVQFTTYGYSGPQTLVGGSVVAYRAGETTPISTGITLTVDFSGVTGLHLITIDTTGYQTGKDYNLVLASGTVDGESRAGALLESFSIELESALRPSSIADIATAVWSYGTRTLTSLGTVVVDTAAEVWNAPSRTLTSFGTLVADTAAAVWSFTTRTLTAFGFGNTITLSSPVATGNLLTVKQGDDYSAADSRPIDFTYESAYDPSSPTSITLKIYTQDNIEVASWSGSVIGTSSPWTLRFEPTAAETGAAALVPKAGYRYDVEVVKSSRKVTLVAGSCTIVAN